MSTKRVLLIDTIHPIFKKRLLKNGVQCDDGFALSKEEVLANIENYIGICIRSRFKIDAHFIDNASNLKFIARAGAGMENINVEYAEEVGIHCLHAPEGNRDAVGEHAMMMLLALMNNLRRSDAEVRNGIWKREENRGDEIQGKTIGIIGFGNMGKSFSKKLIGFEAKILAYDKYVEIESATFSNVEQVEMEAIFERCDIVSLHLPLSEETNYFADEHFFNAFKKPIYFINTARGKNVDTAALCNAMKNGKVKGAALDVIEYESTSFEKLDATQLPAPFQYLAASDKAILTPHIAGWTHESNIKIAEVLVEKILKVLNS